MLAELAAHALFVVQDLNSWNVLLSADGHAKIANAVSLLPQQVSSWF